DQDPCAVAGGFARPGREGRTRRGDGFLSMFGSGSRRATDNARTAARVGRIEQAKIAAYLLARDQERIGSPQLLTDLLDRPGHRLAILGDGKVGHRLVAE